MYMMKAIIAALTAFATPVVTAESNTGTVALTYWVAGIIAGLTAFQVTYWVPNKSPKSKQVPPA